MASNVFASIAAATAAKYIYVITDRGVEIGVSQSAQVPGRYTVNLSGNVVGQPGGATGGKVSFHGEGATSTTAKTAALANLNNWRVQRYGGDSTAASSSTLPEPATSPSTQGVAPTLTALTKDVS